MNNGISLAEQETVINFYRIDDRMSIYTSDQTMISKLRKSLSKNPQKLNTGYLLEREEKPNGRTVAIEVSAPKNLFSLRNPMKKRDLTDEERKAMAERMRKVRNHGND